MTKTISQKITFKNTTPKALYNLYMDAKLHTLVTGATAKIDSKEGTKFQAYDGYITGKNLQLIKDILIVQSWRADDWDDQDIDSTFIMKLEPKGNDVILKITHANVPEKHYDNLGKGWTKDYWELWKNYLANKKAK